MPRFYGDRMDTIIEKDMTLDDAMRITNHSTNSECADYGSHDISDQEIDTYLEFSSEDEEETIDR